MCKDDSRPSCCHKPDDSKGDASNCSKEQIADCHGMSERHPCIGFVKGDSTAKRLYLIFLSTVICAPIVFLVYLKNDLVCAPRAIVASAVFGIVPLISLTVALSKEKEIFFYLTLSVLVVEVLITPIIMLKRLGWEKFVDERLLAFFTFEGIAIAQVVITLLLFNAFLRKSRSAT